MVDDTARAAAAVDPAARRRAGPREWAGLMVIVLSCVVVSMDISVLFYAVPFLAADLQPSSTQLLWVMDIYGFVLAGLLITMGSLGDRIGRRRLLLIGSAAFTVASVLAAYSTSPAMLIASRALLGIGGATLAPSTLSLIRNMFLDGAQRRTAIGIWTAGFALGGMLGPITAGLLLEHFWWGSVFLVNVPIMVLLLVLGPLLLPEFRTPGRGGFEVTSALLSLGAVLPVIYGCKRFAESDFSWLPISAVAAGLGSGVLFIRRQRRIPDPMIDLKLFADRRFAVAISTTTVLQFAMLGMIMLTSQYVILVLGISPFRASLWQLPAIGTLFLGLALAGLFAQRARPAVVVGIGLGVAAIGFFIMTLVPAGEGLATMLFGGSVMTLGVGMVVLLATDVVLATAPPNRAGVASALSETSTEFGGAMGIALLGAVTAGVYQAQIEGSRVSAGLPATAADGIHNTLAEALQVAQSLPGPVASAVQREAVDAFTNGLHAAVLVGSGVLLTVGVVAVVLLRAVQITHQPDQDEA